MLDLNLNRNRNQIEEFDGTVVNTYKYLFVVKPNGTGIKGHLHIPIY